MVNKTEVTCPADFFLLTQMPEEEAFCVLVQLMQSYKMRDLYKPSMADLSLCFYQLDKLVEVSSIKRLNPFIVARLLR